MAPDGHWYTEVLANVCFTAEYICLRLIAGRPLTEAETQEFRTYLLSKQNPDDGSWGLAPASGWPGDVSTTVEGYFALKLLGVDVNSKVMRQARTFILAQGGPAKVNVQAQLMLCMFGLVSWDDMGQCPAELILMPDWVPINVFAFSYWARVTAVAVMILRHHKPVFPLPGDATTEYLDELYPNPADKSLRFTPPLGELWRTRQLGRFWASCADKIAGAGVEPWLQTSTVRKMALSRCVRYIIDRTEPVAGYGSFWNSNFTGAVALMCEGFQVQHPVVQCMLTAVDACVWRDRHGSRMQVTVGPIWDTSLMAMGLLESGLADDERMDKTVMWFKSRQILSTRGDYEVKRRGLVPGGWAFQYVNNHYPDNDDTLVSLLTIVMHRPKELACGSGAVTRAIEWLLGMQCSDDGWGCFDIDNNNRFLNLFPFGQGNEFFDETVPDITGRVIECFCYILNLENSSDLHPDLRERMRASCVRALGYLQRSQDPVTGGWGSRWHVNYLNGTPSVLCGLGYFKDDLDRLLGGAEGGDVDGKSSITECMIGKPIAWLKSVQNEDGGWGEGLESYVDSVQGSGRGVSTPTQTAWVLLGLLSHLPPSDPAITRGVEWLVRNQIPDPEYVHHTDHVHANGDVPYTNGDAEMLKLKGGGTWAQDRYVSVGFPSILWLDYVSSRHGYPMIALGRYLHAIKTAKEQD